MTIEDSRFKNAKMVQQDLSMNLLNFILCLKLKILKLSVFLAAIAVYLRGKLSNNC